MTRSEETTDPRSCLNKALPEELTFVLLARDAAAPQTIVWWAKERIRLGLNTWDDLKIQTALAEAKGMIWQRGRIHDGLDHAAIQHAIERNGTNGDIAADMESMLRLDDKRESVERLVPSMKDMLG